MPELERAVHSLMPAGQLVVMSLGHFGVVRIWEWAAARLARKAASLRDLESGKVWDFAVDPGAGYEISRLVAEMSNRLRTEKARTIAAAAGKLGPRQRLADDKMMAKAKRLWADPTLSAQAAANEIGIGVATLYRHLGPKGEAEAKPTKKPKKPKR